MDSRPVIVYVHYGNFDRKIRFDDFKCNTSQEEIYNRISSKLNINKTAFWLEFKDSNNQFVDFDYQLLGNVLPIQANESPATSVDLRKPIIHLYVKRPVENQPSFSQLPQQTTTASQLCSSPRQAVEHHVHEQRQTAGENSPNEIIHVKFITNLNPLLHDGYASDGKRTRTGKIIAKPVSIQGYKMNLLEEKQRTRVLPKLKVFGEESSSKTNLHLSCHFIHEICENGQRSLYVHPIYEFTDGCQQQPNQNLKTTKTYNIPWHPNFLDANGHKIDVKLLAVVGAKTHSSEPELFHRLENQYSNDTNYETNRLAIVIEENGPLTDDKIFLSEAIEFCHAKNKIELVWYEVRDNNGALIEKIPQINKNMAISTAQAEIQSSPPIKKRKTSNTQRTNTYDERFNGNQPSTLTIITHEATTMNLQDFLPKMQRLDANNDPVWLSPRDNQGDPSETLYSLNTENSIVNEPNALNDVWINSSSEQQIDFEFESFWQQSFDMDPNDLCLATQK